MTLTAQTHAQIEQLIRQGTDEIIRPAAKHIHELDIHDNGIDKASEIDLAMENFLREKLGEIFPDAVFLCEESSKDPKTGDADWAAVTRKLKGTGTLIIIDPLDGTNYFLAQNGSFGTILSIFHRDAEGQDWDWQAGYISDAYLDVMISDRTAHTPPQSARDKPMVHIGYERRLYDPLQEMGALNSDLVSFSDNGPASCRASMDCFLGKADGYCFKFSTPWDLYAGQQLLQKAGFIVTGWDGEPMAFELANQGIIAARSPEIHAEMMRITRCLEDADLSGYAVA